MKSIVIMVLTVFLFACNNPTDKKSIVDKSTKDSLVHVDSFYIDEDEVSSNEYKEFHSCDFDKFLKDLNTPKLAKDVYLDNEWSLTTDTEALALLDSLTAENNSSRPFYFKVVTKTMEKSDGYFSEGLGSAGKEYVEKNTQEFVAYFDNKQCFTNSDLTTWDIVMLEFSLIAENESDKLLVNNYVKGLNVNCKDCSSIQKETLKRFSMTLEEQWRKLVKNLNQKRKES